MNATPSIKKEIILDLLEKQDYIGIRRIFKENQVADVAEVCSG